MARVTLPAAAPPDAAASAIRFVSVCRRVSEAQRVGEAELGQRERARLRRAARRGAGPPRRRRRPRASPSALLATARSAALAGSGWASSAATRFARSASAGENVVERLAQAQVFVLRPFEPDRRLGELGRRPWRRPPTFAPSAAAPLASARTRQARRQRASARAREGALLDHAVLHHLEGRVGQAGQVDQRDFVRLGGVADEARIRDRASASRSARPGRSRCRRPR